MENNPKKSGSSDDSDNEEDETAKLFQEYERIKNEKKKRNKNEKNREKEEELNREAEDEIMRSNPLIEGSGYSLAKRWYEDSVFKNQAKTEPKQKKRFINDTVRSDFHKRFLSKYILN